MVEKLWMISTDLYTKSQNILGKFNEWFIIFAEKKTMPIYKIEWFFLLPDSTSTLQSISEVQLPDSAVQAQHNKKQFIDKVTLSQ